MANRLTRIDPARLSRPAAWASAAAAAFACLWLLARLLWLALPQADDEVGTVVAAPATPAPPPPSIAKWHLFGNPQTVSLAQLARNAPATTLKLTLRGTLALPDPRQGIAVIADEHGGERAYKVGEEVNGGARLSEVYTDHVVLTHEGAAETLTLPRPEEHAPELPAANQRNLGTAGGAAKTAAAPLNYVPPAIDHGALDWSRAQQQLQLDPAELARQVHIEPVFENGKIAGARLSGGGQVAALMQKAGIKPTDLITAVNGTALAGLSNPQQFMDNLRNASSLQVTVLRDGKPATLTLDLR
jgi:general secretion pathway protein C